MTKRQHAKLAAEQHLDVLKEQIADKAFEMGRRGPLDQQYPVALNLILTRTRVDRQPLHERSEADQDA